ncbi:hypothetical protein [Actinoplanes sp. NPDC049265]|uniref:hypothetical protein n=1 Tax=Actinoplanes sp. NPDC049265 TaxID=3363902 RepID=UPI00371B308D
MNTALALEAPVQAAVVTATGAVLAALIGVLLEMVRRSHKKLGQVEQKADVAVSQVHNSHATNLRDDIDRVLASLDRVEHTQRLHTKEIGGLREEIRHERVERNDLERRVDRLYER